jgi:glycosyltransferase involved in cell wall biosynthesis
VTKLNRLAFIGNSLPRRCGIATFTTDLQQAVAIERPGVETCIVAMNDRGNSYDYPPVVCFQAREEKKEDYIEAAEFLNGDQVDVVSLQHEFGIFGGDAGNHILSLLSRLTMPVVTTLHTILPAPSPVQHSVITRIVEASAKVVVMSEKGRDLLRSVYHVPQKKIEVIPHGIPDFDFVEPHQSKARLGFSDKAVILTFGLLSPNKGIEVMIDAMPSILERRPDAVYVILGATHPNLVRDQGEAYRESLIARVRELALEDHVVFLNQFVDRPTLLEFIAMCDVYVTPYLNEAQMTSGTLAYSFGLGKAVVSTPYWHARELLADGRGVLVPFGDAAALSREIGMLLTDEVKRQRLREGAYSSSRSMTWARTAERYIAVFEAARRDHRLHAVARPGRLRNHWAPPEFQLGHFLSMCDDTGIFQHAIHSVPDRSHGYCVDDNARALLLACALSAPGERRLPDILSARLASFVQHAWNPDAKRFRNFMSFSRNWLEDIGSEDSHGRSLWALGECARSDASPSRRRWAADLFSEASAAVRDFRSPRAWAFALLGLDGYCTVVPGDADAQQLRRSLADKLMSLLAAVEAADWVWFEEGLAYDNARLPQALLVTGRATAVLPYIAAGTRSLRWLIKCQSSPEGRFRPVGTKGFGDKRKTSHAFDQQPLEAAATIAACRAAWSVDGNPAWKTEAERAFDWFLGNNDLSVPLVDAETGSCRDGLHPDRPNENKGAESLLSYLLGLADIRQITRMMTDRTGPVATKDQHLQASDVRNRTINRGHFAPNHVSKSTGSLPPSRPDAGDRASFQAGD